MKPHPRNARIKGSALLPNRFIFGDALDASGLESCEYLVHTEAPAFVCRLIGNDDTDFDERDQDDFASAVLFDEDSGVTVYVCNPGFRLFDFTFQGDVPTASRLQAVCDEAMTVYMSLQDIYAERDAGFKLREMRIGPDKPLPPAERSEAIATLTDAARDASANPMSQLRLMAAVQQAMGSGDRAVFTEAQLALNKEREARNVLLNCARDSLAFPELVRPDGSILSFELWALPFAFSRTQGGVWWHFPQLERIEPLLADALELPEKAILWVSPTLFTVEMLNEHACQDLVHLASVMDAGCDYAPFDPDAARATYEASSRAHDPQLVLCWIPFLVERGTLPLAQARRLARQALDAVMPEMAEAIGGDMPYGEAELFAPLPWWEALETAVHGWNRKRLGLTVALVASQEGGLDELEAIAEYAPDQHGYQVALKVRGKETISARTVWLMVPDLAPDRECAWQDLADCLREAGIPLSERLARLH
jgi:hypothetical protein